MQTLEVVLEPVTAADEAAVTRIVREQGLPNPWCWPQGLPGTAARIEGRLVAFCVLKESPWGLVIDELWPEKSRAGLHGMKALGDWIESLGQRLADQRGEPLDVGGIVRDKNAAHREALEKRGYAQVATILTKRFLPGGAV